MTDHRDIVERLRAGPPKLKSEQYGEYVAEHATHSVMEMAADEIENLRKQLGVKIRKQQVAERDEKPLCLGFTDPELQRTRCHIQNGIRKEHCRVRCPYTPLHLSPG